MLDNGSMLGGREDVGGRWSTNLTSMSSRLAQDLLIRLVDDAAVFPPGLAPLPRAVTEHLARTAYRRYVGPLLVPAASAAEVVTLAADAPLQVALIARPGTPIDPILQGARLLAGTSVELVGVEVGAAADWPVLTADGAPHVPVTVEIPRDGFDAAFDAVAQASHARPWGPGVQAKFRTGATPVWAWPDEPELARFLVGAVARDVPFKLTGGLHHVLRADHPGPDGGPQHGLLNVLAALQQVIDGADTGAAAEVLAERDPAPLIAVLTRLSAEQAQALRGRFTAYGCCDVLDPVRELADLGLIDREEPTTPATTTGAADAAAHEE